MAKTRINLAVLISGSGSNLQALIDACARPDYPARIAVVISNRPDAYGLQRAKDAGLDTVMIDHKEFSSREEFDAALASALTQYDIDLVCLAGFMRILTPEFTKSWEGRMINIHPALLPRHGGAGFYGMKVHEAVIASGDTESGASVHYVIAECDAGDVILQRKVPVAPGDTPESLAEKVLKEEHKAYPQAVEMLAKEMLNL